MSYFIDNFFLNKPKWNIYKKRKIALAQGVPKSITNVYKRVRRKYKGVANENT
jgi:hypothetical protein